MHWLIPAVSHSASGLLAWQGNTLTATALVVSFLLAAAHSFHVWASFYGQFALLFAVGTILAVASRFRSAERTARDGSIAPWTRTAIQLLSNALVATALVQLHQFYLKQRMEPIPWFHRFRSRAGCFPVPSQTLHDPIQYGFVDSLGNALPFGIVASYATAMAWTISSNLKGKAPTGVLKAPEIAAALVGALAVALTAASTMPRCGSDEHDGSHDVMMHVDRSTEWKERTPMTWSTEAIYTFVVLTTVTGITGAAVGAQLVAAFGQGKAVEGKAGPKSSLSNGTAVPEKASGGNKTGTTNSATVKPALSSDAADSMGSYVATLCMHLLMAAIVVFGVAIWSWTGPRESQLEMSPEGAMQSASAGVES